MRTLLLVLMAVVFCPERSSADFIQPIHGQSVDINRSVPHFLPIHDLRESSQPAVNFDCCEPMSQNTLVLSLTPHSNVSRGLLLSAERISLLPANDRMRPQFSHVPEPSFVALLVLGLGGLFANHARSVRSANLKTDPRSSKLPTS